MSAAASVPKWESEAVLVGALFTHPEVAHKHLDTITPEHFLTTEYATAWRLCQEMRTSGRAPDYVSLCAEMRRKDVQQTPAMSELLTQAHRLGQSTGLAADYHARVVRGSVELEQEPSMPRASCALTAPPPPRITWRIERLITRAEPALIVSDGGVGKTSLAVAICGAVANGSPVFGNELFVTEAGPVLYISEEDSAAVLLNRMEALIVGHGWNRETVLGNFHYFAQEGVSLDSPKWRKHILEESARLGVGLVVFDPYADLTTAKENDNDAVKPLIRFFREIATTTGATPLILHHAGKVVEGKRKVDRIRGASGLNAHSRCTYFLENVDDGIGVECLKLSRAEKPAPFVVSRNVTADAANPAIWRSARLAYLTQREAADDQVEKFLRNHLSRGVRLNTSELKELAKGTGISAADISTALKRLEAYQVINFEPGPKGAKRWGLCLPEDSGNQGITRLPSLPTVAGQPGKAAAVVAPIYRKGNHSIQANQPRQAGHDADELEGVFDAA